MMDAHRLPKDQRHALMRAIQERADWLHRLHMRQRSQKWKETDPAYLAVLNAHDAMKRLLDTFKIDPAEAPAEWMKHIGK